MNICEPLRNIYQPLLNGFTTVNHCTCEPPLMWTTHVHRGPSASDINHVQVGRQPGSFISGQPGSPWNKMVKENGYRSSCLRRKNPGAWLEKHTSFMLVSSYFLCVNQLDVWQMKGKPKLWTIRNHHDSLLSIVVNKKGKWWLVNGWFIYHNHWYSIL